MSKQTEAVQLRAQGLTLQQIGERLGVSRQYVHQQLHSAGQKATQRGITCRACAKEIAPRRGTRWPGPVFCLACLPSDATFGQRLLACRVAAKLTQQELAAQVGVPMGMVTHWENGRRRPTESTLANLIRVLPGLKRSHKNAPIAAQ